MKISSVRSVTCSVPLSRPIQLGEITYTSRDYAVIEIRTDEGISGFGYGMTRGGPVSEIVNDLLGPQIIGEDPLLIESIWHGLYLRNLTLGPRGLLMRGISMIDLALWDIKGKAAGLPVWKLIGGDRTEVQALVAGGYPREGRSLDDLAAEISGYLDRGIRKIKIASDTPSSDTDRLEAARSAAKNNWLAIDLHWSWPDLPTAQSLATAWKRFDLAWLEDPFPSDATALLTRLRDVTPIPLALGEDGTGRWQYRDLIANHSPGYLRIDATVMGGMTEAVKVCALAEVEGIPVSPHIFPEIHVHLAAAFRNVFAIEFTDPPQEIDLVHALLSETLHITDGRAFAPDSPGLGFEPDPASIVEYTIQ